ncbi:Enzymatic polyprotein [Gracilariopsis chorda]|uniref:Enzymatic polyprotein n=1 Tax=Gracilariopsis chorda TaxID=448386 RepID=A0A2V3ILD2_9FLOR|nr:Enzymatic polyprotein [Gracilariopsis chorda]|eukprot:PXF42858.1 Enzymatic polyprotein [Gracilariopsis chorda]
MTDASEKYWSGVVTHVHRLELHKEITQQAHLPLTFVGQAISSSQQRLSTPEKEAYAIYQVFRKLDYFFLGENPVHVYTDHRNLMFAFNPHAFEPTLGRHVITKVQRWALSLSQFDYTIEHILGKLNIFADMLKRWTKSYQTRQTSMGSVHSLVMRAK